MLIPLFKPSPRKKRMEHLAQQLAKLLDEDFNEAFKCDNTVDAQQRIRRKEQLIESELSALRMLQSEDRLTNNLLIPLLTSIGLIIGAVVLHLIRRYVGI